MYICLCKGVTDAIIKNMKTKSLKEVVKATRAGTQCGKCIPQVKRILSSQAQDNNHVN